MLSKTYSYALSGIDSYLVTIEVDCSRGLPATIIVGLPDSAVKESRERVQSAVRNSGFELKPQKITINLSPADTKIDPSTVLDWENGRHTASQKLRNKIIEKIKKY